MLKNCPRCGTEWEDEPKEDEVIIYCPNCGSCGECLCCPCYKEDCENGCGDLNIQSPYKNLNELFEKWIEEDREESIYEQFQQVVEGVILNKLPTDAASQVDHYVYCHPMKNCDEKKYVYIVGWQGKIMAEIFYVCSSLETAKEILSHMTKHYCPNGSNENDFFIMTKELID